MKTYLIFAAMKEEIDGLFSSLKYETKEMHKLSYCYFKDDEIELYGFMSGIGKVSMAFTMGLVLAEIRPDYIINIGVAGSIASKLHKMDIFVSDKVCYWDVDLTKFSKPIGQMSDCPLYFDADRKLLSECLKVGGPRVKSGLILSGDSFIAKENIKPEWFKVFDDPIACDMESAAVAQVAYRAKIPFVIIRAISDAPVDENDNKDVYESNLEEAAFEAGELAKKIILK